MIQSDETELYSVIKRIEDIDFTNNPLYHGSMYLARDFPNMILEDQEFDVIPQFILNIAKLDSVRYFMRKFGLLYLLSEWNGLCLRSLYHFLQRLTIGSPIYIDR